MVRPRLLSNTAVRQASLVAVGSTVRVRVKARDNTVRKQDMVVSSSSSMEAMDSKVKVAMVHKVSFPTVTFT